MDHQPIAPGLDFGVLACRDKRVAKLPQAASLVEDEDSEQPIAKGGVAYPFPWRLHRMLEAAKVEGDEEIVSWQPHGRSFKVHRQAAFVEKYLKRFFRQSKYPSFQRQLNLYGFCRLSHGPDKGAYYHFLFVRGQRFLVSGMIRQKIKGNRVRRALPPDEEPNFYIPNWDLASYLKTLSSPECAVALTTHVEGSASSPSVPMAPPRAEQSEDIRVQQLLLDSPVGAPSHFAVQPSGGLGFDNICLPEPASIVPPSPGPISVALPTAELTRVITLSRDDFTAPTNEPVATKEEPLCFDGSPFDSFTGMPAEEHRLPIHDEPRPGSEHQKICFDSYSHGLPRDRVSSPQLLILENELPPESCLETYISHFFD